MTASREYLESLIAERLGGDKQRIGELFNDDSVYKALVNLDEAGSYLYYRPRTYDGWYFVVSADGYDVYYQERSFITYLRHFDDLKGAADHFYQISGFTTYEFTGTINEPRKWWKIWKR